MDILKPILIGCGVLMLIFVVFVVGGIAWLATGPEGGVRLPNDMEDYATAYLAEQSLLNDSEELLAYYDVTLRCDGSEAAILTTERLIYHNLNKEDIVMNLADIEDIQYRKEGLIGDVFEVYENSGKTVKIEIAPLNNGETFKNVLMKVWEKEKDQS